MNHYQSKIVLTLRGDTDELEEFRDRLDWSGSGAVLEMYDKTSGEDRESFIRALGQIIESGSESPAVIAQILHIASSLNLAQLAPNIRTLESKHVAELEPVRSAIRNFQAYRELVIHGHH